MPTKIQLQKPHITSDKNGVSRIVKENPMVRIHSRDHGTLIVQGGQVFAEDGVVVENPPQWFVEAYSQMSPEIQEQVGLDADDLPSPPPAKK